LSKKIVLVTCGTLGDLHPYLTVAEALQSRGHSVILATSELYRNLVTSRGIEFQAVPPDLKEFYSSPILQKLALRPFRGTEFIIRKIILPEIAEGYKRLLEISRGADLIVGHFLAYEVPLVAETLGLPWLQVYLHPMNILSIYDPPTILNSSLSSTMQRLSPQFYKGGYRFIEAITDAWMKPVKLLREQLGLACIQNNPLVNSASPFGTMCWFPKALARPQPDWHNGIEVTGYPFSGIEVSSQFSLDPEIDGFLRDKNPIIFTLGSTAVLQPKSFFEVSAKISRELKLDALLIGASHSDSSGPDFSGSNIRTTAYLPYEYAFPKARLVVHHGGMGSIAQSLKAAKRMIIVPFAWDQPDNAERVRRLGIASVIRLPSYTVRHVSKILDNTLKDNKGELKAKELAEDLLLENGTANACRFIERYL